MAAVGRGPAAGPVVLLAILAGLGVTVGLSLPAWGTGLACGLVTTTAVARSRVPTLGPADRVTVVRLALACGVAALVAEAMVGDVATGVLVGLASVALLLDAVDGVVARRSGTASAFGARFDGEADAFLLLVLSVHVANELVAWAVVIGAARYVFAAAGWVWPWLRAPLPRRDWRKVVTATQGIVLVAAASGVAPLWLVQAALGIAVALLAESFGRDVWWLWRTRPSAGAHAHGARSPSRARP